jgi:hypothetical protein
MAWPKKQSGWKTKAVKSRQRNKQKSAPAKAPKPAVSAELEPELAKIRDVAPLQRVDRLNKFLERVLDLRLKVESTVQLRDAIKSLPSLYYPRTLKNFTAVIIQLTAPHVTANMRNKYVNTLEYAFHEGIKPNGLVEFIQRNTLNGCCDLWKKKYGKKRRVKSD